MSHRLCFMWGDSMTVRGAPFVNFFTSYDVVNCGVGGQTSTQIKDRFLALPEAWDYPTIIWTGHINHSDGATIKADIAAMVAKLTTPTFLIVSAINGSDEASGTQAYDEFIANNADLATIYGERFCDLRPYMVGLYDPESPQDVLDHDADIVPSSLREDALHLNILGRSPSGEFIAAALDAL